MGVLKHFKRAIAVFSVVIMITVTWNSVLNNVSAAKGRPEGPFSTVAYRIEDGDDEHIDNMNVTIQGSILIESGGRLTINGSFVTIDSRENGLERIEVMAGGELIIEASTIKANESQQPMNRFRFVVNGTMLINGSIVKDLFGEDKVGGIEVTSQFPVVISNTSVENALTSAIFIRDTSSVTVDHVIVKHSKYGVYVFNPSAPLPTPIASFTVSDDIIRAAEPITFTATAYSNIKQYFWDFGDGETDVNLSTEHAFVEAGLYTVNLTVTDLNGTIDTETANIQVLNRLPIANSYSSKSSAAKKENLRFLASGSYDPDGTIEEYKWVFDDNTILYGEAVTHAFQTSGNHDVDLTVKDNDGDTDTMGLTVAVSDSTAPVADAGDDLLTYLGRVITVDASGSAPGSSGSISKYVWDWGDGSLWDSTSSATHKYTEVGSYVATLTVSDSSGLQNSDEAVIVVKDAYWPELMYNKSRNAIALSPGPDSGTNDETLISGSATTPSFGTSFYSNIDSAPVIGNGYVYSGIREVLYAHSLKDSDYDWTYPAEGTDRFYTSPTLYGDILLVIETDYSSSRTTRISALDATPEDGVNDGYTQDSNIYGYDLLWAETLPTDEDWTTFGAPLVINDTVHVFTRRDTTSDGKEAHIELYLFDIDGLSDGDDGYSDPSSAKNEDIIMCYNGIIDRFYESPYWYTPVLTSSPAYSNGMIVLNVVFSYIYSNIFSPGGPWRGYVYGIRPSSDPTDYEIAWTYGTTSNIFYNTPSIENDRVALLGTTGVVTILDVTPDDGVDEGFVTGESGYDIIQTYIQNVNSLFSTPILMDGEVYFGTTGDPTGYFKRVNMNCEPAQLVWSSFAPTGYQMYGGGPAIAGDRIYAGLVKAGDTGAGNLWALDRDDGQTLFTATFEYDQPILANIAVAGGSVYYHTTTGYVNRINDDDNSLGDLEPSIVTTRCVIGEVRTVTGVTSTPTEVHLNHDYIDPVIIAKPLTYNDADPAVIRVVDVDPQEDTFDLQVQNWDWESGDHDAETVNYIAVERGNHTLPGGFRLEAGRTRTYTTNPTSVTLGTDYPLQPVILTQNVLPTGYDLVTTRVQNADTDSFQVLTQNSPYFGGSPQDLDVNYIIMNGSLIGTNNYTLFETGIETDGVDSTWQTFSFGAAFSDAPVFFAATQTVNDAGVGNLRYRNLDSDEFDLMFQDAEGGSHDDETAGWLAFDPAGDIVGEEASVAFDQEPEGAYNFTPPYNESLLYASSRMESWIEAGAGSNEDELISAQRSLTNALVEGLEDNMADSYEYTEDAIETLLTINNCVSIMECFDAIDNVTNGTARDIYDFKYFASHYVDPDDPDFQDASNKYTWGMENFTIRNYVQAMTHLEASYTDLLEALETLQPDITASPSSLTFSDNTPYPGQTITLGVTVTNKYYGYVESVDVAFYVGDPATGADLIGTVQVTGPLGYQGTEVVTEEFTPDELGAFEIFAAVDCTDSIEESNEGNNNISRWIAVMEDRPFPVLSNLTISDNEYGVFVNSTPTKVFMNLTIRDSTIYNSSIRDIQLVNASGLETYDTFFSRNSSAILDTSTLARYNSLTLTVQTKDYLPAASAPVNITPKGGTKSSTVANDTGVLVTYLKDYVNISTGITDFSPFLVNVTPMNEYGGEAYLVMDGPRELSLFGNADADKDDRNDSSENTNNLLWMEAEYHRFNDAQLVYDGQAFQSRTGHGAIKALPNNMIVNGKSMPNVENGNYALWARAKYKTTDPTTPVNPLLVLDGVTNRGYSQKIDNLTDKYNWYHLIALNTTNGVITFNVNQSLNGADSSKVTVLVDRIMLQRWRGPVNQSLVPMGQATDPAMPDSDFDFLNDGQEYRNTSFWFEAEDYRQSGSVEKNYANTSNGRVVERTYDSTTAVTLISIPLDLPAGTTITDTYIFYVRLNVTSSNPATANVYVRLDTTTKATWALNAQDPKYNNASILQGEGVFKATLPHTMDIRISRTGSYPVTFDVDYVHLVKKNDTFVNQFDYSTYYKQTTRDISLSQSTDRTVIINISASAVVTNATFTVGKTASSWFTAVKYTMPDSTSVHQEKPDIDYPYLVYQDMKNGNWDIYVADLLDDSNDNDGKPDIFESHVATKPVYRLTYGEDSETNPAISGTTVAFECHYSDTDICYINLTDDTDHDGIPDFKDSGNNPEVHHIELLYDQLNPDISGYNIVWEDAADTNHAIYLYDIQNNTASQISVLPWQDCAYSNARISGDYVVYERKLDAESNTQVVLRGISEWTIGFDDPTNTDAEPRFSDEDTVEKVLSSGMSNDNLNPDIYGGTVIWENYDYMGATRQLFYVSISNGTTPYQVTPSSMSIYQTTPNIDNDMITWSSGSSQTEIMVQDLGMDTDNDGISNFHETVKAYPEESYYAMYTSANYYQKYPVTSANYVAWESDANGANHDVAIARNYLGFDVGQDSSFNYKSADFVIMKRIGNRPVTSPDLADVINEYLKTHQGQIVNGIIQVPIKIHTEATSSTSFRFSNLSISLGYATDPLNADTDMDALKDGIEVNDFFGADIIEAEDAMFVKEWKNPYAWKEMANPYGKAETLRMNDTVFMHQTGVTLTASNNMTPQFEGYQDSYIVIPYRANVSGQYRLEIWPSGTVQRVVDVVWVPEYQCPKAEQLCIQPTLLGYVPHELGGTDIYVPPSLAEGYLKQVIENATYINITKAGGETLQPVNNTTYFGGHIKETKVGMGIGDDSLKNNLSMSFDLAYYAQYNFTKDTNYEIIIGLDMNRLTDAQINPLDENLGFEHLSMLRIPDLDRMRVEMKGLNPLLDDTDNDTIKDGRESEDNGYPLNPDPDHDGINDFKEKYVYGTDPERRDTDLDSIRDGVELGLTSGEIVTQASWGSWTERIAAYGSPYIFNPINNYDAGSGTTDPLDIDTDNDGIPDGWVDGWTYKTSPITEGQDSTYQDSLNLRRMELRYDQSRWYNSGEVDNLVQIYEGEDLNINGAREIATGYDWNFDPMSFERMTVGQDETDATNRDSDVVSVPLYPFWSPIPDDIPDGYEVWFSAKFEPKHDATGMPLFSPTAWDSDIDVDRLYGQMDSTEQYASYAGFTENEEVLSSDTYIALAQRLEFGQLSGSRTNPINFNICPSYITEIQVRLNLERDSDSKVTLEIWDSSMDQILYGLPRAPLNTEKPVVDPIEGVGNVDGWYGFKIPEWKLKDTPDPINKKTNYYIVVRYVPNNGETISWYNYTLPNQRDLSGLFSVTARQTPDGLWHLENEHTVTSIDTHSTLMQFRLIGQSSLADGATNLEEYIAGTNPKNPNTDNAIIGSMDKRGTVNDSLLDGIEMGVRNEELELLMGGIVFRTSVTDGALSSIYYTGDGSETIWFDANGGGAGSGSQYAGDGQIINASPDDPCFDTDNIPLFTLEDNTRITATPDFDFIYILLPDIDEKSQFRDQNGELYDKGTLYRFEETSSWDGSEAAVSNKDGNGAFYIDRQLFLGDPTNPDTDMDGILDGLEVSMGIPVGDTTVHQDEWNNDNGWKANSEAAYPDLVFDDKLPNIRDQDSDGDGLLDSQEVAYFVDSDGDGYANMADPDSDNDGLLDGLEVQASTDTDGDDGDAEIWVDLSATEDTGTNGVNTDEFMQNLHIIYDKGANMLDVDSDGDHVGDAAELNPYLLSDDMAGSKGVLDTRSPLVNVEEPPSAIAYGPNGELYFAESGKIMKLATPYDRFGRTDNNGQLVTMVRDHGDDIVALAVAKAQQEGRTCLYILTEDILTVLDLATNSVIGEYSNLDTATDIDINGNGIYISDSVGISMITGADWDNLERTYILKDIPGTVSFDIESLALDGKGRIIFTDKTGGSYNMYILEGYQTKGDPYLDNWELVTPLLPTFSSDWDSVSVDTDSQDAVIYRLLDDFIDPIVNDVIMKLAQGYTTNPEKNAYRTSVITDLDKDISSIALSSKDDIAFSADDVSIIYEFMASRSSMVKRDSDNDGLTDGESYSSYTGELTTFTVNVNSNYGVKQTITTKPTFPTKSDSDGDGISDGNERLISKSISVLGYNATYGSQTRTGSATRTGIHTDPSNADTDGDTIPDGIEGVASDPTEQDSDFDGLKDYVEDANKNGKVDKGETGPLTMDSDEDYLPDGWDDHANQNGYRDTGEAKGEDVDADGIIELATEPDPANKDTDGDTIIDGVEFKYLLNTNVCTISARTSCNNGYRDSDNDGKIDLIEADADADGLPDGIENGDMDLDLDTSNPNESDPYYPDTDGDDLVDGAEATPYIDLSEDFDTDYNVLDQYSNDGGFSDGEVARVVFRTDATDTNGDGFLDYVTGTHVQIPGLVPSTHDHFLLLEYDTLWIYGYAGTTDSIPSGTVYLNDTFGAVNIPVTTPERWMVYYQYSNDRVYINIGTSETPLYSYYTNTSNYNNAYGVVMPSGGYLSHNNEVTNHQITIDWRYVITDDSDFDGVANLDEISGSETDADYDNDGVVDGSDYNWQDPDCDDDGIPDGTEMGIVTPVPTIDYTVDIEGTDITDTFTFTVTDNEYFNPAHQSHNLDVKTFIADADPTTVTDPLNPDTDGDGIHDGIEDINLTIVKANSWTITDTNFLNGKLDAAGETSATDKDTDDDGLPDGNINGVYEDQDCDGWTEGADTISFYWDTDRDNVSDGTELGLTISDITSDTNLNVSHFAPDTDGLTTSPTNWDTDGDGVPDGWIDGWTQRDDGEIGLYGTPDGVFQFGEGEDKNGNGRVDAVETSPNEDEIDSDGDGLLDGWDIPGSRLTNIVYINSVNWGELSFGEDHDLGDSHFQSGPTDPTSVDSDGDGLVDGDVPVDDHECELDDDHSNGIEQAYFTDPSNYDTDGDGLSDGLEVWGWEVHIIREKDKKEVSTRMVFSDPTCLDGENGGLGDGILDYDEYLNGSDPYSDDTDGDHILDQNEEPGALTQIEGKDPEFIHVYEDALVTGYMYYKDCAPRLRFSVKVKDNAGIKQVTIKPQGEDRKEVTFDADEPTLEAKVEISWGVNLGNLDRYLDGGFNVNFTVEDLNGNKVCGDGHVDGVKEKICKAIIEAIKAVVEAIKAFLDALFDWIWDCIQGMINSILRPIVDSIEIFITNFAQVLENTMYDMENNKTFNVEKIGSALFNGPMLISISAIIITLTAITFIVLPFVSSVATLSSRIIDFALPIIISGIIQSMPENNLGELINNIKSGDISKLFGSIPPLFSNYNDLITHCWIGTVANGLGIVMSILGGMLATYALCWAGHQIIIGTSLPSGFGGVIIDTIGLFFSILGIILGVFGKDVWSSIFGAAVAGIGLILCIIADSSVINPLFNQIVNAVALFGFIASYIAALDSIRHEWEATFN